MRNNRHGREDQSLPHSPNRCDKIAGLSQKPVRILKYIVQCVKGLLKVVGTHVDPVTLYVQSLFNGPVIPTQVRPPPCGSHYANILWPRRWSLSCLTGYGQATVTYTCELRLGHYHLNHSVAYILIVFV